MFSENNDGNKEDFLTDTDSDLIPLVTGSPVYVSKSDLVRIFSSKPPVYTVRLAELIFGKEQLIRCSMNKKKNNHLEKTDPIKMKSLIGKWNTQYSYHIF